MEYIILIIVYLPALWLFWGVIRCVFVLSIAFALTPTYCLQNKILVATKHSIMDTVRGTSISLIICSVFLSPRLMLSGIGITILSAIPVSFIIRLSVRDKAVKKNNNTD